MGWQDLLKDARQEISLADHISFMTLPMVKDKNVFLNLLKHIDKSILTAIRAYLAKLNETKELRIVPHSDELTRRLFFESYTDRLMMSVDEIKTLKEIEKLVNAHNRSQMDLKRGEEYVMILDNFKTVTVNENRIKNYLNMAKNFIRMVGVKLENG